MAAVAATPSVISTSGKAAGDPEEAASGTGTGHPLRFEH